jgi:3-oxoacyl-[acyl-carrier protein] reductase
MQTVVITGAAGGIGREMARLFRLNGDTVVLVDHPTAEDRLKDIADRFYRLPATGYLMCRVFTNDVTDAKDVHRCIQAILEREGRIDVLVNAAGIMPKEAMKTLVKTDEEVLSVGDHVMDVNYRGTRNCCRAVLPHMRKAGYGRIVNIASVVGCKGDSGNLAYAASKAAVISLTKTLACEAPFNKNREEPALDITVNAVAPGIVETSMTDGLSDVPLVPYMARNPQRRKIQPVEVAYPVLWLASKEASAINGACLPIDGGYLVSS